MGAEKAQNEPTEPSAALKKKVPTPPGTKETKEPEKAQSKPVANAQNEPSEPSTALKKKVPTPLGAKQTEQAETVQLKPTESAPKTGDTLSNPPKLKPGKAESIEQAPDDQSKKLRVTEAQKPSRAGTIEEPKKLLKPVQVGTSCLSIVPFIQTFSINISFFFSLFLISSLVYHLVRNDQCWIHHIELEFPSSN